MRRKNSFLVYILGFIIIACNDKINDENIIGTNFEFKSKVSKNEKVIDLNRKGLDLLSKGNNKKAEEVFLEALELENNNYILLNNYGLSLRYQGEIIKSINLFEKSYAKSDSTYHAAGINLSRSYHIDKQYSKGIEVATYVINNSKDKSLLFPAYCHRIGNYISINECEKARKDINFIKKEFINKSEAEKHINALEIRLKNGCG